MRSESEHACDDAVLNTGFDAKKYAAHLLDIARALNQSGRAWFPVLAMAAPHLERRFVAMLNPSLNHRAVSRVALSAVIVLAFCTMLPLSALHAREVTLHAHEAPTTAALCRMPGQLRHSELHVIPRDGSVMDSTWLQISFPNEAPPWPIPETMRGRID